MAGVYFFQFGSETKGFKHNPVKIGMTTGNDPEYRLNEMNTAFPVPISNCRYMVLLEEHGMPNAYTPSQLEGYVHGMFKLSRKKGEWFDVSIEDIDSVFFYWNGIAATQYMNEYITNEEEFKFCEEFYRKVRWNKEHLQLANLDILVEKQNTPKQYRYKSSSIERLKKAWRT